MLSAGISIAIYVVGLVFAAGVAHARDESLKKDVNGVGVRVRSMSEENGDHHRRLCMALMAIATDEQKQIVVALLGEQQ